MEKRVVDKTNENTEEALIAALSEWKASGIGLENWCRNTGHRFYKMRGLVRRLRRAALPTEFLEVKDEANVKSRMAVCVGNCRIELANGFDPDLLRQVVQALGGV